MPTLIMSVLCMIVLYIVKVQVNQRFKDKMRFPVPVELLVVGDLFINIGEYLFTTLSKLHYF